MGKKEKILITGGAGFIGSHIADLFINQGYEVVIVDDLSGGSSKNINKNAHFYKIDINDPKIKIIFEKEKPEYICHQAAQISVFNSVNNPGKDAKNNIMGLLNLLKHATSDNYVKGIIFASSGGTVYGEPEIFPIDETVEFSPKVPYGITKVASEYYLNFFQRYYGLNYISLRYGNVYGPRQNPFGEAGVIAIFINKIIKGEQPTINGDGEYIRDYVYVEDVAQACLLSLKNMLKLSRLKVSQEKTSECDFNAFNIGTGKGISVNQLFAYLQNIFNVPLTANYGPARPGDLRKNILNCNKAKEYLGWEAIHDIEAGLRKTVEWFKRLNDNKGQFI